MGLLQSDPVTRIKGIGKKAAERLALLGIQSVGDLLYHFPRGYRNYSEIRFIASLRHDDEVTVSGYVQQVTERRPKARLSILSVIVVDDSGVLELVYFNQSFRKKHFWVGQRLVIHGKVKSAYGRLQMNSPEVESLGSGDIVTGRIRPQYPLTEGLRANYLENWIHTALTTTEDITETLPHDLRQQRGYGSRRSALQGIHCPSTEEEYKKSREELAFDELFYMQLGVLRMRKHRECGTIGIKCAPNGPLFTAAYQQLPYQLTKDQQKALRLICDDMEGILPMRRLVQGDVGSGKTIVAALAMVKMAENGYQSAMMAPTEILASQHYESLQSLLSPLGLRIDLLTGRMSAAEKKEALQRILQGETNIVVGTHALIEDDVTFAALGLVITDEQHRFGVRQRMKLEQKEVQAHTLVMTATPIPRTMALSVYGDLDVSLIREMPPGRKPVQTFTVNRSQMDRIYRFFAKEMSAGHQVYVVCPLVEESAKMDLKAAREVYAEMKQRFGEYGVGLVYGSLKSEEKQQVMQSFAEGEYRMLVATSVVEVGVNVPNATIMYIDGAERFGLSQLHQLRGRVGRGSSQSYCLLMSDSKSENAKQRLHFMEKIQDGFVLAEKDLLMRGAGELFGYRQHGLPDLKVADLVHDLPLLLEARQVAEDYVDSELPLLDRELRRRFGEHFLEILYH